MKTLARFKTLYLMCSCYLLAGSIYGENLDPCQDEDVLIQDQHRLCVNTISPASKSQIKPCGCDPRGATTMAGKIAMPKEVAACHISSENGGKVVLTGNVKIDGDLNLEQDCIFAIPGDLTVCGKTEFRDGVCTEAIIDIDTITANQAFLFDQQFENGADSALKIGTSRIIGQKSIDLSSDPTEALRVNFSGPTQQEIDDFNSGAAGEPGEATAAWAELTIIGNWPGKGDFMFKSEHYLSSLGFEGLGINRGSKSIGDYKGVLDTATKFDGSKIVLVGQIDIPPELDGYTEKPIAPDGSTDAVIQLRTFGGISNTEATGTLYYDVIGPRVVGIDNILFPDESDII